MRAFARCCCGGEGRAACPPFFSHFSLTWLLLYTRCLLILGGLFKWDDSREVPQPGPDGGWWMGGVGPEQIQFFSFARAACRATCLHAPPAFPAATSPRPPHYYLVVPAGHTPFLTCCSPALHFCPHTVFFLLRAPPFPLLPASLPFHRYRTA